MPGPGNAVRAGDRRDHPAEEATNLPAEPAGAPAARPSDPATLIRTRGYAVLLVIVAVLGVPLSAGAFGFLAVRPVRAPRVPHRGPR